MEIFFYQAECGDAGRLRFIGDNGIQTNILIDSGYERTFDHVLKQDIKNISTQNERIDLWCISHIHDDHIGGVIKYLNSVELGELKDIVDLWYYNPPRNYLKLNKTPINNLISSVKSISQGDYLYSYLASNNKILNYDITDKIPTHDINGLKITILSPSDKKLKNLRNKYKVDEFLSLERNELMSISEAVRAKSYDYEIKIEDFDLQNWDEDNSIENGSSITLLTEYKEIKILWLADAHPSNVVDSIKQLGYTIQNKLKCDFVKVTHHGSKGNNNNDLYDLIECNNYIYSVNGENLHYLPTKESIARILRNTTRAKQSEYTFYFTYDNLTLRKIFSIDGSNVFSKWGFKVEYLKNDKFLKFNF